jgi:aspartyl/asparaginyl beta-hydroxylase (cupin superfamily)
MTTTQNIAETRNAMNAARDRALELTLAGKSKEGRKYTDEANRLQAQLAEMA